MTLVQHIKQNYPNAYKVLEQWRMEKVVMQDMEPAILIQQQSRQELLQFSEWPNEMTLMYLLQFLIDKHYSLSVAKLCPEHVQAIIESGFGDYEKLLTETTK